MTPAARRGCAESVARSPVRAASCALPTNRAWCVHVASLVGVGVNQRRALLLVRPSVRPLVSLDLYIVLPIESPRTHSAYYAHAIRRARSPTRRKQASMNTNRRSGPRRPPASARRSQHQAVSLKGPVSPGRLRGLTVHSSRYTLALISTRIASHVGAAALLHTQASRLHTHMRGVRATSSRY